jgi:hypothetical protein
LNHNRCSIEFSASVCVGFVVLVSGLKASSSNAGQQQMSPSAAEEARGVCCKGIWSRWKSEKG